MTTPLGPNDSDRIDVVRIGGKKWGNMFRAWKMFGTPLMKPRHVQITADGRMTITLVHEGKGRATTVQAWTDPEGSRRLRLPQMSRQSAHIGGKVVTHL